MELSLHMERGEGQDVVRLIEHIQTAHIREPGVASSLVQFLVQMGMVRPDGTMVEPPGEEESAIATPAGKLWTPDGDNAGAQAKTLDARRGLSTSHVRQPTTHRLPPARPVFVSLCRAVPVS